MSFSACVPWYCWRACTPKPTAEPIMAKLAMNTALSQAEFVTTCRLGISLSALSKRLAALPAASPILTRPWRFWYAWIVLVMGSAYAPANRAAVLPYFPASLLLNTWVRRPDIVLVMK